MQIKLLKYAKQSFMKTSFGIITKIIRVSLVIAECFLLTLIVSVLHVLQNRMQGADYSMIAFSLQIYFKRQ
jgi:type IV secretory pathway VirB3-like protein